MKNKRLRYIIATIIFLAVEVFIALFVHDNFIRPYIGDVLVVILLYTFINIWAVEKVKLLSFYIFIFAAGVELLQYFEVVKLIGAENNTFFRVLIGTTFDVKDIICYAAGCLSIGLYGIICGCK